MTQTQMTRQQILDMQDGRHRLRTARARELEEENARLHERVEIALSHEINRLPRLSDKVKPPVEED